jgi:hypothetical protein
MIDAVLDKLIHALRHAKLEFTAEDLADALWLAHRLPLRPELTESSQEEFKDERCEPVREKTAQEQTPKVPPPTVTPGKSADLKPGLNAHLPTIGGGATASGVTVQLPDTAALPNALAISRAMRPLRRRQATKRYQRLDEAKTADRIAASNIWIPVLSPGNERCLEAAIVVDCCATMAIWKTVLREFQRVVETLGAFRRVHHWWLDTEDPQWTEDRDRCIPLYVSERERFYRRNPLNVVNTSGRQFILVISDCVSDAWWDGRVATLLSQWGESNHTAILQMLPKNMWERTAVGPDQDVLLQSKGLVCPNANLAAKIPTKFRGLVSAKSSSVFATPVLELNAESFKAWARWLTSQGPEMLSGRLLAMHPASSEIGEDDAWALGHGQPFLTLASTTARKLANIMSVSPPFNLPLLRVIRESMLGGEANQSHEAEFLLGGLVKVIAGQDERLERPDEVLYDFCSDEIRKLFRPAVSIEETLKLLRINQVSQFLGQRIGHGKTFAAFIESPSEHQGALQFETSPQSNPIAHFTEDILHWLGGSFAGLIEAKSSSAAQEGKISAGVQGEHVSGQTIPVAPPPTNFRIRVVGSSVLRSTDPSFDEFCFGIGRAIALRGHTLVIASIHAADGKALEGFASANPKGQVIFVFDAAKNRQDVFPDTLDVKYIATNHAHGVGALTYSDAVIAIGGANNTSALCEHALRQGWPLLTCPTFGGAGAWFFQDSIAAFRTSGTSQEQLEGLEQKLSNQTPEFLLQTLESWHELHQNRRMKPEAPDSENPPAASSNVGPTAWILVAGTGRFTLPKKIRSVAEHLGDWLAKNQFGLITAGWIGVDFITARSFANALRDAGTAIDDYLVHVVKRGREPDFTLGRRIDVDNDEQEYSQSVDLADGVLLIGGLGGTRSVGVQALKAGKPLYPLAFTHGDAKQMFNEILEAWEKYKWLPFSKEELIQLNDDAAAVKTAESLLRRLMERSGEKASRKESPMGGEDRTNFSKNARLAFCVLLLDAAEAIYGVASGQGISTAAYRKLNVAERWLKEAQELPRILATSDPSLAPLAETVLQILSKLLREARVWLPKPGDDDIGRIANAMYQLLRDAAVNAMDAFRRQLFADAEFQSLYESPQKWPMLGFSSQQEYRDFLRPPIQTQVAAEIPMQQRLFGRLLKGSQFSARRLAEEGFRKDLVMDTVDGLLNSEWAGWIKQDGPVSNWTAKMTRIGQEELRKLLASNSSSAMKQSSVAREDRTSSADLTPQQLGQIMNEQKNNPAYVEVLSGIEHKRLQAYIDGNIFALTAGERSRLAELLPPQDARP